MLLGTFVDEVWWPSCGKLRECTRVGYESAYRCHIQTRWAGVDMESITANDIEEWLGSFEQAGAARKAWAVLRAMLRLAYRKGVTDNDVTRREIRLPHLRRYEPRVLDARQVRRLLKGFYGHALEAWLLVSVCAILLEGVNGQRGALSFDHGGKVAISGSMNSGYYFRVCGCWMTLQ